MSSPLWMSIEPERSGVRIMLSEPAGGTSLKARLPWPPQHHRALPMLLEALSAWYRLPLHAVLDADASAVRDDPEAWALYAGDLPGLEVTVEWVGRPPSKRRRDPFLASMGDFSSGRRLLTFAATGQR
jgi:hypothetical protein